jgi:hypothetical protein
VTIRLADVVHRDDTRMLERGGHQARPKEPVAKRRILGKGRRKHLKRHLPFEVNVVGEEDVPAPARGEWTLDPEGSNLAADERIRSHGEVVSRLRAGGKPIRGTRGQQ